jgi:hypothetical protein
MLPTSYMFKCLPTSDNFMSKYGELHVSGTVKPIVYGKIVIHFRSL